MKKQSGKSMKDHMAFLTKKYELPDSQSIVDIVGGCLIVLDRECRKFTIIPPDLSAPSKVPGKKYKTSIRVNPLRSNSQGAIWTSNIAAAYRAAADANRYVQSTKPILVVYDRLHMAGEGWGIGHATVVAGRVYIVDVDTGKKAESSHQGAYHWPGTIGSARLAIAHWTRAAKAATAAEHFFRKRCGPRLTYVEEMLAFAPLSTEPAPEARKARSMRAGVAKLDKIRAMQDES